MSARQAAEFAMAILKYRPEIVMYHLGGTLRTFPWIAKLLGTKRIIYQDGTSRTAPGSANWNGAKLTAARFIAAPIHHVIAATEYVRRTAVDEGIVPSSRITVIPNGVDVQRAGANVAAKRKEWRDRFGIPEHASVVMQVGWIVPAKGFDKLLHAAKAVVSQHPETMFVMVGTGDHLEQYRVLGESLGIGTNVKWIGAVTSPFDDGVYAMADVYCQLSQWQEAGAYTLAEAMSYGLPMVVSNVGGIPEAVRSHQNGFVLEPTDVCGIAQSILCLLNRRELRERFGQQSREIATQYFDVELTTKQYLQVFGIKTSQSLPAVQTASSSE
jgi:glycosyltransferase involved in cell wall biosynthesis